ncbi:hypothetical protein KC19_VG017200 [Ceratodon purpureus]|uniref:Uncharacterized protein n=1 Tax=Ceratodon purpureus TaxID=3225 RepID=A0A8T0HL32_CERPU|nr:hypothetical protein KC19_VG017200 [Ceratodon purpureus]
MECYRGNCKGSYKEGDTMMERMIAKWAKRGKRRVEEEEKEEEERIKEDEVKVEVKREEGMGEQLEGEGRKGESGEEFMREVMQAVRQSRQLSPRMMRREKLVRLMKRDMERVNTRPGSFVAESLCYHQNLARAYLRFGLQSCPTKEELAVRESRMLRRKMMMLSQEEQRT